MKLLYQLLSYYIFFLRTFLKHFHYFPKYVTVLLFILVNITNILNCILYGLNIVQSMYCIKIYNHMAPRQFKNIFVFVFLQPTQERYEGICHKTHYGRFSPPTGSEVSIYLYPVSVMSALGISHLSVCSNLFHTS